jgi:hypothetical protein
VQWTKVENRDPVKTYNKVEFPKLAGLAPGYNWKAYLVDSGVQGKIDYLVISQPSYITGFNKLLQQTPLPVWKTYFRWRLLSDLRAVLSKNFVDEHFAFYGTGLRGVEAERAALEARPGARGRSASVRDSESSTSPNISRRSPRRAWTSWSRTCWPPTRPTSTRSTGWAGDQKEGAGQARPVHHQDRLSAQATRLQRAADRQGRSARGRDSCAARSSTAQSQQARPAHRSRRMGYERADGQRLLQSRVE